MLFTAPGLSLWVFCKGLLPACTDIYLLLKYHVTESAPGSPRSASPVPTKTEEVSNLKTMPKGLSASLPDLDSEAWIEVKKRPRPSPIRPKVVGELH